ncbi:hypothetical protein A2839_04525 [Candidatus Uhrbacteria bacterium RIFCSPHIGHO2_01_FULL_47_10]|nr:MAG: hypothetical protein A2839_04525 [Candidatus Uhrbacteria bacterium RIFCSPHIGHO2_01_FULL_47_10]
MKLRALITSLILFAIPLCMHAAAVSPATIDLVGGRGESIPSAFTVINTQTTSQTYYLDTLSFTGKDESGEPQFSSDALDDGLSKWIVFLSDRVVVPARSKVEVPFTVQVPADVASGTYQSAITVSSAPTEVVATNGAIIEAKTAILVFLNVKGDSVKKAALLDFLPSGKGIRTNLHQTVTYRIQNQGNVYTIPEGTIELKDLFGRTLQIRDANEAKHRVLPMSTRSISVTSQKPNRFLTILQDQTRLFAIGPIQATLSVNLGEGFDPIRATTSFWYIPYQLLLTSLFFLGLVFLGYRYISKIKKT